MVSTFKDSEVLQPIEWLFCEDLLGQDSDIQNGTLREGLLDGETTQSRNSEQLSTLHGIHWLSVCDRTTIDCFRN